MDWEAIGLLQGLSEGERIEIIPLLDYGLEILKNFGETTILDGDDVTSPVMTISLPAIRRIYSEHGNFDVEHMIRHLSAYWSSDRTRSLMNELNVVNGIDGEAEMLAQFCGNYKPQPMKIEPKKVIKAFKLKKYD